MNYLVDFTINDSNDWDKVVTNPSHFQKLAQRIFEKNNLSFIPLEFLVKASNAVFLSGEYIVKIIILIGDDDYDKENFNTEIFGIKHCQAQGISTVNLVASGQIEDKYIFNYLIMKKTIGNAFTDEFDKALTIPQKLKIGKSLRKLTEKMNVYCDDFNGRDYIEMAINDKNWGAFPRSFQYERMEFINKINNENPIEKVFVHADINPQNILCGEDLGLTIIDFADALLAPKDYEIPVIMMSFFDFDKDYIKGYFGDVSNERIAEICANSLLYHYYGHYLIKNNLGDVNEINSIAELNRRILARLYHDKF